MRDFLEFLWQSFALDVPRNFLDWPLGTILAVVTVALDLIVLALVLGGLWWVADSWFRDEFEITGYISGRRYTPPSTMWVYNAATKMSSPVPVPASWALYVAHRGETLAVGVSRATYEAAQDGDAARVTVVSGRISGSLYPRALALGAA